MNVFVDDSEVHGSGVFAYDTIYMDDPQLMCGEFMDIIPGSPLMKYVFEVDDESCWLPWAPWCFLNHDVDPNCEVIVAEDCTFWLHPLQEIMVDQELTIDYGYQP